jgi:hypothetical protein
MLWRGSKCSARRGGQVVLLFPAVVIFLCAVAAITVDIGSMCATKARLQNGADAASLAAMMEVWEQRRAGNGEGTARDAGRAEAERIGALNAPGAGLEVTFGVYDGTQFEPAGVWVAANACRVRASRDPDATGGPQRTFFGGLFGVRSADIAAGATATFLRASDLIPFCIPQEDVGYPGDGLVMYESTQAAPGVFGLVDFDGGANSATDTVEWTADGYRGDLFVDPELGCVVLGGTPGWEAVLNKPIDERIARADPVVGCIYRSVSEGGANTEFEVIGFVQMIITERGKREVDGQPRRYVGAQILGKYIVGDGETYGDLYRFMNLQLVE